MLLNHYMMLPLSSIKNFQRQREKELEFTKYLNYALALTRVIVTIWDHKSGHSDPSDGLSKVGRGGCVSRHLWQQPARAWCPGASSQGQVPGSGSLSGLASSGEEGTGWQMRGPETQSMSKQDRGRIVWRMQVRLHPLLLMVRARWPSSLQYCVTT